ncbi:MAG: hypothetical protein IJV44_02775 [Prevotella sp.]|nr:hypothetical protein [Prevotella sp.]MBQ9677041.1 hypothetical protein [Prevotella sp.]
MDSIDHLRESMGEIDTILSYASHNTANIEKYQMFNKIAIVLLSTKFEVFIEEFIEEHSMKTIQGHTNATLPLTLKNAYIDTAVDKTANVKNRTEKNNYLQSLLKLMGSDGASISSIANIRPSIKFNYGKHGQKEIEAIFDRHGMGVFIKTAQPQTCLAMINSLIAIRNNVIHQDASPGLTHQTIKDHKDNVMSFVSLIESDVNANKLAYYNEV